MTRILLTGAGFSHNWGGWLATEAFEYLIGSIHITPSLRNRLWVDKRNNRGFEETLAALQGEARGNKHSADELTRLQTALTDMFAEMNRGFSTSFPSITQEHKRVVQFLKHFDAIFTLNQDLFLEYAYISPNQFSVDSKQSWQKCQSPGVRLASPLSTTEPTNVALLPHVPDETSMSELPEKVQPYFKLHGSSNWQTTTTQGSLLVMGGGKEILIQQHRLLTWYHSMFKQYLEQPKARLMVIGFSFSDPHIEKPILDAVSKGLGVFIIDPRGVDVLDKHPPTAHIPGPKKLLDGMQPGLIGASRRGLRDICGFNAVEFNKVMRFFDY